MKKSERKITKREKSVKNHSIKQKINGNTTFEELMKKYPETAEILMMQGMHCIGCGMAGMETIEQGAIMHGLDPKKLIEQINKKINKKND